ncbi:MAG: glycosyl hydrolase family 28-related protein, partial [Candidatus Levyibacteriota bacterium]
MIRFLNAIKNTWEILFHQDIFIKLFLITAILFTIFATYSYFNPIQDTRSRAENPVLNVKDFGAKGDGSTDDTNIIRSIISTASKGTTVYFPSGTYVIRSTINLKSDVSLQGDGTSQTILTMPAQSSQTFIMSGTSLSNVSISDMTLSTTAYTNNVNGIYMVGAKNSKANNLRFDNLSYGMKLGSGPIGSGWIIEDIVARNCEMPIYASYIQDSSFTRLDLEAAKLSNNQDHTIYLEREIHRVTFTDVNLKGGSGYTLQLYLSGGSSSNITFQNLTLDSTTGRYPLVIGSGFSNLTFRNTTLKTVSGQIVQLYGGSNVTFNGFTASGGDVLIRVEGNISNILFKNGAYTGKTLVLPTSASGLTLENVTTGSSTTTKAPTIEPTPTPTPKAGNIKNAKTYGGVQQAIDAASPGDSVYIPSGIYDELVRINNKSNLTLYGDGELSIVKHDGSDDPIIQINNSSNIVFHDFTVQGNYERWVQTGINVEQLNGGKFYNLSFKSIGYTAFQARTWAYNKWDTAISNVEFYNNTVEKAGEFGIYIGAGVSGFKAYKNNFGPNQGRMYPPHAVYVQDANNVWIEDNYAYGTTKSNGFAYKAGVQTVHGHIFNIYFNRNVATGNFGGLWLVAAEDVYVNDNQFIKNTNEAIQLWADNKRIYLKNNTLESQLWAIRFNTDGAWSSNIHLVNNRVLKGVPIELSGGPASMIVDETNNSWQPGFVPIATTTTTKATTTTTTTSPLAAGNTILTLDIGLDGIGTVGDNLNSDATDSTQDPLHKTRKLFVSVY